MSSMKDGPKPTDVLKGRARDPDEQIRAEPLLATEACTFSAFASRARRLPGLTAAARACWSSCLALRMLPLGPWPIRGLAPPQSQDAQSGRSNPGLVEWILSARA
jgi:hypothetical protein